MIPLNIKGVFHFFSDDTCDAYDAIQWIENQRWCNGSVGMEGPSYMGGTQLLAARTQHPALKCIMPTAFIGNFTQNFPYCNGVPSRSMFLQWHKVAELESWDDLEASYGDVGLLKHPVWGEAFRLSHTGHRSWVKQQQAASLGQLMAYTEDQNTAAYTYQFAEQKWVDSSLLVSLRLMLEHAQQRGARYKDLLRKRAMVVDSSVPKMHQNTAPISQGQASLSHGIISFALKIYC